MQEYLNLVDYPLDRPGSDQFSQLVQRCQRDLKQNGMFNLEGFLNARGCLYAVEEITPVMQGASFTHRRAHNIYFQQEVSGLNPDHPALQSVETVNHTVCADQIENSLVVQVYEYLPLRRFLAEVMNKSALYLMKDSLARANVMAYRDGEALNWHFDRSEFTTTLLLQSAKAGGEFQYRHNLRSDTDPNYEGVAKLLAGADPLTRSLELHAGTLNVFLGKNTAHRVTAVEGETDRMIAVFSYYEHPGRVFSDEERIGFYGRAC
jgi:hypothetical protein